jgi:glycine/D-amino acid oxidase-like deaminating enzyme
MPDQVFEPVDVAIVGGGIVGSATAYSLARRGVKVAMFERGRIASEQSSRAWGFIRQQGRHEAEVPLAAEANRLWAELTQKFGQATTEFTQAGILVPAENDADEERVVSGHDTAVQFQLKTRILKPVEMREVLPELAGNWRCALFTPGDGHGEPASSSRTIADAARHAGARIHENEPVLGVDVGGGKIAGLITLRGRCAASTVVLCGGIGTPALAAPLGLNLPIQVVRSSVAQTMAARPFTRVAMWGPYVSFRPKQDGSFYIGNGYRGAGADYDITINSFRNLRYFLPAYRTNWRLLRITLGREFLSQLRAALSPEGAARPLPEPLPNRRKIQHNIGRFRELLPHLGGIGLARSWAGRIDLTPDVIPIIDKPLEGKSLFIACGFSGHGFALGPSVGKQLSEWVLDGRPSIDLRSFRYRRFEEGDIARNKKAL